MAFTYNLSNNIGKIRNLIGDVLEASALLTDEEITSFLSMQANDLYMTAALCLRRIAANKVLVARVRKSGDFMEDTRDIVKNMMSVAKTYEDMSKSAPAEADAETIYTDFNYQDIRFNRALRGESE